MLSVENQMSAEQDLTAAIYTHDEHGKRVDIHRPSAINPGDYEFVKVGRNHKDEIKGGPGGTCHHCGKAIVWEVVWKHLPTDTTVTFGYICTEILGMSDNRIEHEMVLLKRAYENMKKKLKFEEQHNLRRLEFEAEHPKLAAYFAELDVNGESSWFIKSVKRGYEQYGSPLPNQIAAVERILKDREEEISRRLAAPLPEVIEPLAEGRYEVVGKIVKHKYVPSAYGSGMLHKMTVQLEDGNKVYGTVPASIDEVLGHERSDYNGVGVSFVAQVERSKKDPNFGFFKRPTQGKVLNVAE